MGVRFFKIVFELNNDFLLEMTYKDALQDVLHEILIMKKLDHPNVIRLHEVLDDDAKEKLYMSKHYLKNLKKYLKIKRLISKLFYLKFWTLLLTAN